MKSALVALVALAACSRAPLVESASPVEAPLVAVNQELDTSRWVDSTLESLSTRERVAQMVMFWTLGDYVAVDDSAFAEMTDWVVKEGVGGITMSLGTPIEVAAKLNYWQRRAKVPLLVAADLEPALMRLEAGVFPHYLLETGGATAFPTAMAIAAAGRDEDAYNVGRAIAREGRAVGIHVNFAPVADVNNNPGNPIINTRSFGENPKRVARLTAEFIRGTHDGGMFATAKHFPGHGDTDVDSHVGLPVVTATAARMDSVELVPFRAAIRAGVDLVMSAHIAFPALGGDSTTPATLRPDVMHTLLRDSLGFHGVTITDALSMGGVGKGYAMDEAVVRAVQSGTDILLKPSDRADRQNNAKGAIDAVMAAIARGDLTSARIDSSARRILWMKARLGLATSRVVNLEAVREVVATKAHRELAADIAQRAVTLLRDSSASVPLAPGARVAIVNYMPETEIKAGRAFARELQAQRAPTGTSRVAGKISPASVSAQLDSLSRAIRGADRIVIATYVRRVEGEGRQTIPAVVAAWIDSVAADPRTVVVSFGNPYVLRQFPRVRAYINTYGVSDVLEVAAARALAGKAAITGTSPVSLPGFFSRADGLKR